MSKQTDQLLLFDDFKQETNDGPSASDLGRAKERLRLLENLAEHKGYQMFMEALKFEAQHCLIAMDKAETPTGVTKYGAHYYSLTMAHEWLVSESARLRAFLQTVVP